MKSRTVLTGADSVPQLGLLSPGTFTMFTGLLYRYQLPSTQAPSCLAAKGSYTLKPHHTTLSVLVAKATQNRLGGGGALQREVQHLTCLGEGAAGHVGFAVEGCLFQGLS